MRNHIEEHHTSVEPNAYNKQIYSKELQDMQILCKSVKHQGTFDKAHQGYTCCKIATDIWEHTLEVRHAALVQISKLSAEIRETTFVYTIGDKNCNAIFVVVKVKASPVFTSILNKDMQILCKSKTVLGKWQTTLKNTSWDILDTNIWQSTLRLDMQLLYKLV